MKLPEEFLKRMKERLGDDFPAFLQSYDTPPARGVRVNRTKMSVGEFTRVAPFPLEPVPWEKSGFYAEGEKLGADPYHFAGLYYCQEPSAMMPVNLWEIRAGERVLDLCAAPGGKSTQIAERLILAGGGLLVANEIESSRAKILSENCERLGLINTVVTNAAPSALAARLPARFDKILVDAPCSGEGMFAKEPQAIRNWSEANVKACALRQSAILDAAAVMLKAGGELLYSTCTFSPEENEEQIAAFLSRHKEFELVAQKRIYPHEMRGEGQFAALLKKTAGDESGRLAPSPVRKGRQAEKAYTEFCAEFFIRDLYGDHITVLPDGRMFALPEGIFDLGVKILRAGTELGEWDGKNFKPAHALVTGAKKGDLRKFVALSREEVKKYLSGEEIAVEGIRGWCAVGVEDYPLGLGKASNGVIKNHYPKGLRLRV